MRTTDTDTSAVHLRVASKAPVLSDRESDEHAETIRRWVLECDQSHAEHKFVSSKKTRLPTRVIDVGDIAGSGYVRLRDTNDQEGSYITLGHLWAYNGSVPRTTHSNFASHCDGIPWHMLPRGFQDAVIVCQMLEIRYLWIDSLCIIQDSLEDWQRESNRMDRIFASAYLRIAPTFRDATIYGFLKRANNPLIVFSDGRSTEVPRNIYLDDDFQNFDRDVEQSELCSRQWCFLERIFSSRTIYYAETHTYWECGSAIRYEGFPEPSR